MEANLRAKIRDGGELQKDTNKVITLLNLD